VGMRTRRGTVLRPPPDPAEEEDGGEEAPGAAEMVEEEEDFQEAQFRAVMAALESGEEAGESEEEEEEEEEVLGLQLPEENSEEEDGEEEEEEEDEDGDLSMASDLEERHRDSSLPHELSWGQRKQLYYDTDYGGDAQAKGKRRQQEVAAEEEEEEQEARVIQRRLVQGLGEEDYGLDAIQGYLAQQQKTQDSQGQKIDQDLQALPKKEQLKLLKQESPELLQLLEDLEVKLMELKDELHPLLQMARKGAVPRGKGSRYLQTKYHLYLSYCANISFYLVLKAKRVGVRSHPVIERLVAYRNVINELAAVDQRLSPQVRALLRSYYAGKEGKGRKEEEEEEEEKFAVFLPLEVKKSRAKRAAGLPNGPAAAAETWDEPDLGEEAALGYYKEMEEKLKLKRKRTEEPEVLEGEAARGEGPAKKRGVTYQMVKNRGLGPRRKKVDRNPRVKHREKFRRAKIRRKGQVREVRREWQRYSGEHSGIRAGVKKSRRLQ
ncbi:SAS10 protein, partial [Rostratula benghalensis]|nr:SAS10 protein [Rostratula benghalensis]